MSRKIVLSLTIFGLLFCVPAWAGGNIEKMEHVREARSYVAELLMIQKQSAAGKLPETYTRELEKQIGDEITAMIKATRDSDPALSRLLIDVQRHQDDGQALEKDKIDLQAMEVADGRTS